MKKFPDQSILAEESGKRVGTSECRWIIDPLDGTHLFKDMFTAEKGKGAFRNGKRIRVSRRDFPECIIAITTPYGIHTDPTVKKNFDPLMHHFYRDVRYK